MRQSRKEAKVERMIREGLAPERREAMVYPGQSHAEFADEWGGGPTAGSRRISRERPGGRG